MKRLFKGIPPTVMALGMASFLTDMSSEMIYPLLPVFLSTVLGAGALSLGIIEGVAETTASVLKLVSGIWTDRTGRRKPFVLAGYGLAGLARPLIGLAWSWVFVLAMRFLDRVGKGIRTSPRDALIADAVDAEHRGKAYGFHRSMDHAGAVAGPLIAAVLLSLLGLPLQWVFLLAVIPAVLVIGVLAFGVKESPDLKNEKTDAPPRSKGHLRELGGRFKILLLALFLFTLGNSSDAFILLLLSQAGVPAAWVAVLWALHHVVKMIATYIGGTLSDCLGRRPMILSGWLFYTAVYIAFALIHSTTGVIAVFLLYGIYYGLVEPSEKAWVADMAPKHLRGTAMGYYHATVGIGALPASILFGVLWNAWGAAFAFGFGALLAASASGVLLLIPGYTRPERLA